MSANYIFDGYEAVIALSRWLFVPEDVSREILTIGILAHYRLNISARSLDRVLPMESAWDDPCYQEELSWLSDSLAHYDKTAGWASCYTLHEGLHVIDAFLLPNFLYRQWLARPVNRREVPILRWVGYDFIVEQTHHDHYSLT